MNHLPALMTMREVTNYLRYDRRAVIALVDSGLLSGWKVGPHWRFSRESVLALTPPSTPTRLTAPPPSRVGATT